MDEATIETRVRRLEDIEAIRKLKARCCLHVDREDSEAFADLFVEDGTFIGAFQELRGREAIREIRFWPFMVHYVSNPLIEVGGDSAIGIWYFLRPYTAHDGRPHWASGIYEDEYRRTLDGWRFRVVKITNFFACPYQNGWAGEEIGALTRAAAKSVDMRSM
jgi:ketosteroid isomerase-like protein